MKPVSRKEATCRSDRHSRIVEKLGQLIQTSKQVYSSDLADQLGVSDRTLRSAVLDLTGMSLHRYVRMKRLSTSREKLQSGATSVKSVALECGFWHLSDFAREYRLLFGELPSSTLRTAKLEASFKENVVPSNHHMQNPGILANATKQMNVRAHLHRKGDHHGATQTDTEPVHSTGHLHP
jgi:AraC-like DNA-binding protein